MAERTDAYLKGRFITGATPTEADFGDMVDSKRNVADNLAISDVTGLQTELDNASTAIDWGDITGTLADQTDLDTALDSKSPTTHVHSAATTSVAGFLSAADKTKLNGLDATNYAAASHDHIKSDITDLASTELVPSGGTDGQLLSKVSGSVAWADAAGGGGMSLNEKINQNILFENVARLNYQDSLAAIAYRGGTFDIFTDETKIASKTQVSVSTLAVGADNGSIILDDSISGWGAINDVTYDSKTISVSSQSSLPNGFSFNPDKSKMFILGSINNVIYQYTLSTPGDVSTATYDSVSFSTSSQTSFPTGLFIKPDGTKFYLTDGSAMYQYSMSTAFLISSASYDSITLTVGTGARGPFFRADGLRFYAIYSGTVVSEYSLASAWANISTATLISQTTISTQDNSLRAIWFKDDGLKMYLLGSQNDNIYQYTLGTAWDSSDFTYDSLSFSVGSQETAPNAIFIDDIGLQLFIIGQITDAVYQYTLGSNDGFLTTGNFISTSLDLTGDLAANPTKVVVSSTFATPTDTTLSLKISDGTPANDVTVTSANFDTEVDCSSLTTRTLTLQWLFTTSDTAATPTLNNYGVYFT